MSMELAALVPNERCTVDAWAAVNGTDSVAVERLPGSMIAPVSRKPWSVSDGVTGAADIRPDVIRPYCCRAQRAERPSSTQPQPAPHILLPYAPFAPHRLPHSAPLALLSGPSASSFAPFASPVAALRGPWRSRGLRYAPTSLR